MADRTDQSNQDSDSFREISTSKDRWQLAASAARIGVWDWDLTSDQVFYSTEWMQIRGCGDDEITGGPQECLSRVHPDDVDDLRTGRAQLIEGSQDNFEFEHRVRHDNGSWIWILERSSIVWDATGRASRLVGCDIDITAQKQKELDRDGNVVDSEGKETNEELRDLRDRLHLLLKNASVGTWEWNPTTNKVLWDEGTMQMFGVEPSSFLGDNEEWEKRLHPDDFERMTQTEYANLRKHGHVSTEFRIVRDDGEIRHIYADQFLQRNERNEVTKISGLNMDVTDRKKIEKALQESEDKFQRVAEHVPGVVYRYIVHPDGSDEFTYVSSQIREMFELEPEDAIGDASIMWSRSHIDDHEWLRSEIVKSAEFLEPFLCEYRLVLPKKGIRWVQSYARPVRAENGDMIWDGLVVDHTDHKAAELALEDSQAQFHRMTENVPGMIFRYVLHPDSSHELLYANSRANDFFGLSAESGMQNVELLIERIHPDDLPQYQRAIEVSAETLEEFKQECRIVLDDRVLWVETTSIPQKLANGDVVWDGVTIDITRRKEIQLALEESRSQFQRMTENVPGMICRYMLHPDGTEEIPYVSSQCRELFEVEPEKVIEDASHLFNVIHQDDLDAFHEVLQQSAETLQPVNEEVRVVLPRQGLRWRQLIGQPTRLECGATIFDGVVLDITHAKRSELQLRLANEELATATKMKDRFLANMSHEFRTPLNAILGMTEGLRNGLYGSTTPKQLASLDVVDQSGRHLLELINDILDLATIEAGQIRLQRTHFDVKTLCDSSLRLVAPQAEKKQIDLKLNVPWNLPKLFADEKRIRQVLINLLTNAVKFTPERGVIRLEVDQLPRTESQPIDMLRLSVIDSGIGIPPEMMDSVFLPFVQVDSSLSRGHDGTGLGLALVKQFVDLHGGNITVTSQPNAGSCFTVDLPHHDSMAKEAISDQRGPRAGEGLHHESQMDATSEDSVDAEATAPTILLAEDNDSVATAVTWYLEGRGYPVKRATDGLVAIELAKKHVPDLILMDIQMPNLDGLSAIKQIRQTPGISEIPIVALTGAAMGDDHERCIAAGANGYLSKPCRMEELIQVIEEQCVRKTPIQNQ